MRLSGAAINRTRCNISFKFQVLDFKKYLRNLVSFYCTRIAISVLKRYFSLSWLLLTWLTFTCSP